MERGDYSNSTPTQPPQNPEKMARKPRHRIPGPAGDLQEAIFQREKKKVPETEWMPTQEWLDGPAMDPGFDDSFTQAPWQAVLNLGYQDMEEYINFATVLEKHGNKGTSRVPLTMGVVTKVERTMPYSEGNLFIELKDYTGIKLDGTIKNTVVQQNNLKDKITPGSVLVIQGVVLFKPRGHKGTFNIVPANFLMLIDNEGQMYPANYTG